MRGGRVVLKGLTCKLTGNRPLVRPRRSCDMTMRKCLTTNSRYLQCCPILASNVSQLIYIFYVQSNDVLLHSSQSTHSMLLIPFSLIPVTSCIHELRGLPFLLHLPGECNSKMFEVDFLHSFFAF